MNAIRYHVNSFPDDQTGIEAVMSNVTEISEPVSGAVLQDRDTHRQHNLVWLLPVHAVAWTLAAWLSRGNLDVQGDMVENYIWGIEWQAGYAKHPPLFAWITAAWFRIFPHVDIAYFALSAVNAMTGLLGIVALGGRFLPRRMAVLAALAMAVSPLYSNLAIKFNANAVLLSVWPWTAYFFVRYMQTGGWRSALALGTLAGAAMLGKYFSVVLLLSLFLAALARPAWRARLRDVRVLLVPLAGLVTLAPHVHWLVINHFPTFGYAHERTGGALPEALARFCVYVLAQIAYLAPAFGLTILLVPGRRVEAARAMVASTVRPSLHPDLWWLSFGALFVTGAIALLAKTQMASVWGMAQWYAIAPLWLAALSRASIAPAPRLAVRVLAGYWVLVLVAAATAGYVAARRDRDMAAEPRSELAAAAGALWRQRAGGEIPVTAGSVHEAGSVAFYGGLRTRYWDMQSPAATPWLHARDVQRLGAMFICRGDDPACLLASSILSQVEPVPVTISRHAWGMTLPARRYELFLVPPHQ